MLIWGLEQNDNVQLGSPIYLMSIPTKSHPQGTYRVEVFNHDGNTNSVNFTPSVTDDKKANTFAVLVPSTRETTEIRMYKNGNLIFKKSKDRTPIPTIKRSITAPKLVRKSAEDIQFTWDSKEYPTAFVQNAETGQLISISEGGKSIIKSTILRRATIHLSDGFDSRDQEILVE
ncbi:hypothetical protein I5K02_21090 [Pseudomonas aeruginosa]|nr:hypothetical protein [Pseudomonas aeruginosa]